MLVTVSFGTKIVNVGPQPSKKYKSSRGKLNRTFLPEKAIITVSDNDNTRILINTNKSGSGTEAQKVTDPEHRF
jgi:hypothetical protein